MIENSENIFEDDGSAKIGNVYFRPVSQKDKDEALNDDSPTVIVEIDKDRYARYDVFNTNGDKFLGHLNVYYDRGGYMSFAERRETNNGKCERRISSLTARKLFDFLNFPESRSKFTLAMMKVAKKVHDRDRTGGGWKPIHPRELQKRIQSAKIERR